MTIANEFGLPASFGFTDAPGGDACPSETAPPGSLVFEDDDLDGTCNEQVSVSGASGFTVDCNMATQSLAVSGLSIDAFSSCTITFTTRASASAPVGSLACNLGHVTDDVGLPVSDTGPPGSAGPACTCVAIVAPPQPILVVQKSSVLEVDIDGDTLPSTGDTFRWFIAVQNTGPGVATGARLADPLRDCNRRFSGRLDVLATDDPSSADPGTDTSSPGSPPLGLGGLVAVDALGGVNGMQPGETISIEYITIVDGVDSCCNQATVDPGGGASILTSDDPETSALDGDATCPARRAAAGRLAKTSSLVDLDLDGIVGPGDRVDYVLTFTNTGASPLTSVVIRDPSPPCVSLDLAGVSIDPPAAGTNASSGTTVRIDLVSPFEPGRSASVTFSGTIVAVGSCCNQATWTALEARGVSDDDAGDMVPGRATCHASQAATVDALEMSLEKTLLETSCVPPGAYAHYRLTVRNAGTAPVPSFRLEDILDGSAYWNPIADPPLDIDPTRDYDGDGVDDFLVYLDDARPLAVGASREFTYQAQVPCSPAGSIVNTASLLFDGTSSPQRRSATNVVSWGLPDLSRSRNTYTWDDLDADGRVDAGETIHFVSTVANAAAMGQCEATGVVVTDVIDSRFDQASVVVLDGGTWTPATRTIRWAAAGTPALAVIPPGAEVALSFDVLVDAAVPEPDDIPNFMTVRAGNFLASCPLLPPLDWYLWADPPVPYGDLVVPPTFNLLRNDFVSCRPDAFATIRGNAGAGVPAVLQPAVDPCTEPPAINPAHPETDVFSGPVSPRLFAGDAVAGSEACPQAASGDGRVLVFYQVQDTCVETLRVRRIGADVEVSW